MSDDKKKAKEASLKLAEAIAWETDPENPKVKQFEKDYADGKIEFKGVDAQIRETENGQLVGGAPLEVEDLALPVTPTVIINSPSHKDTNETYKDFIAEWEGSIMCGCDHGCNQWLARNAAKMLAITEKLRSYSNDMPMEVADTMAQRPALEFGRDMFQAMKKRFLDKRKKDKDV